MFSPTLSCPSASAWSRRRGLIEGVPTCALVLGSHIQNAVGVDLEGDLNLGHSSGGRRDACQVELAQQVVVLC